MTESDSRLQALKKWLAQVWRRDDFSIDIASGDASFRRYFRAVLDGESFIIMDAPPDKENSRLFVDVAEAMAGFGLNVPKIIEQDLTQGFLLLSDLGDRQYLPELNEQSADALYSDAIDAMIALQKNGDINTTLIPPYDRGRLLMEMELFNEWFVDKLLNIQLSEGEQALVARTFDRLIESALQQPQVWVHRDYHSRNLMITEQDNPGVLDFQDAVVGPITYDMVSLLRDCYIEWPQARLEQWLEQYRHKAQAAGLLNCDFDQLRDWFDLMGLQRHIKVLGIFSRLNLRDHKPGYLQDIPLVLDYVLRVAAQHEAFADFERLLKKRIVPAWTGYFE